MVEMTCQFCGALVAVRSIIDLDEFDRIHEHREGWRRNTT